MRNPIALWCFFQLVLSLEADVLGFSFAWGIGKSCSEKRDFDCRGYASSSSVLSMGWMDNLMPDFLKQRDGDFVKLEDSADAFGPGPVLLLYKFPITIDDEEVKDMIHDSAPVAFRQSPTIFRVNDDSDDILDRSMEDALEGIASGASVSKLTATGQGALTSQQAPTTVLLFSGFSNSEMMAVYNTVGQEAYQETGGQSSPACAKCVPNAMQKPLRQVLAEIAGDHEDAMASSD